MSRTLDYSVNLILAKIEQSLKNETGIELSVEKQVELRSLITKKFQDPRAKGLVVGMVTKPFVTNRNFDTADLQRVISLLESSKSFDGFIHELSPVTAVSCHDVLQPVKAQLQAEHDERSEVNRIVKKVKKLRLSTDKEAFAKKIAKLNSAKSTLEAEAKDLDAELHSVDSEIQNLLKLCSDGVKHTVPFVDSDDYVIYIDAAEYLQKCMKSKNKLIHKQEKLLAKYDHLLHKLNTYHFFNEKHSDPKTLPDSISWDDFYNVEKGLKQRFNVNYAHEIIKLLCVHGDKVDGHFNDMVEALSRGDSLDLHGLDDLCNAMQIGVPALVYGLQQIKDVLLHADGVEAFQALLGVINKVAKLKKNGSNCVLGLEKIFTDLDVAKNVLDGLSVAAKVGGVTAGTASVIAESVKMAQAIRAKVIVSSKEANLEKILESDSTLDFAGRLFLASSDIYNDVVGSKFTMLGKSSFDGQFTDSFKRFIDDYHNNKALFMAYASQGKLSLYELYALSGRLMDGDKETEKSIIAAAIQAKEAEIKSKLFATMDETQASLYFNAIVSYGHTVESLSRIDKANKLGSTQIAKQALMLGLAAGSLAVSSAAAAGTCGVGLTVAAVGVVGAKLVANRLIKDNSAKIKAISSKVSTRDVLAKTADPKALESFFGKIFNAVDTTKSYDDLVATAKTDLGEEFYSELDINKYIDTVIMLKLREPMYTKLASIVSDLEAELKTKREDGKLTFADSLLLRELNHYVSVVGSIDLESPYGLSHDVLLQMRVMAKAKVLIDNIYTKQDDKKFAESFLGRGLVAAGAEFAVANAEVESKFAALKGEPHRTSGAVRSVHAAAYSAGVKAGPAVHGDEHAADAIAATATAVQTPRI